MALKDNFHAEEKDLVHWMIIFLLRLQAKFYVPDAALQCIVKFLSAFLLVISRSSSHMASVFPRSLYELRNLYQLNIKFKKMAVCTKCDSIYHQSDCVEKIGSISKSKQCTYRAHSNSRECNNVLLKTIELSSHRVILRPLKVYCYHNLITTLQELLHNSSFVENLDHWHTTQRHDDKLCDIYDGRIWKELMHFNGNSFLANPFTLALAINIDWFQPYKLTEASVGAIYLTVMNLPYNLRFKSEYLILLGIIPGPKEPKRDINSFLRPLVGELLGVRMTVHGRANMQNVRCALICVACDMPASRKTCGFLGHSARLGCTRCLKEFPGVLEAKIILDLTDRNGFHEPKVATILQLK